MIRVIKHYLGHLRCAQARAGDSCCDEKQRKFECPEHTHFVEVYFFQFPRITTTGISMATRAIIVGSGTICNRTQKRMFHTDPATTPGLSCALWSWRISPLPDKKIPAVDVTVVVKISSRGRDSSCQHHCERDAKLRRVNPHRRKPVASLLRADRIGRKCRCEKPPLPGRMGASPPRSLSQMPRHLQCY